MANYALIQDGAITAGPAPLPAVYHLPDGGAISNPSALSDTELAAIGWFPISDPPTYDGWTQQITCVVAAGLPAWSTTALSTDAQAALLDVLRADVVANATAALRASDWTQFPDAALTTEQLTAVNSYRTTLRGLGALDPRTVTLPTCPVVEVPV